MTTIDAPRTTRDSGEGPPPTTPPRRRRWRWIAAVATSLVLVVGTLLTTVAVWGSNLRADEMLLPGTSIAGVDVSLTSATDAVVAVSAALDAALDHEVDVVADEVAGTFTARGLGASTDVEQVVRTALEATMDATLLDLAQVRLLSAVPRTMSAGVLLDDVGLERAIAELADAADHDPVDATLVADGATFVPSASSTGFELDQPAAVDALRTALSERTEGTVELAGTVLLPMVDDEVIREARHLATTARSAALDHEVRLVHDVGEWTTTPAELGADVDGDALAATAIGVALGTADADALLLEPSVDAEARAALLEELAGAVAIRATDASVSWSGGRLVRAGGTAGRALDRDTTADALDRALTGSADTVEVATIATSPSRDVAALRDVLVVHQSRRVVELHRGDEIVRSWPVAVGTGGSPTPTGTFLVGAKRFEPTWVNPALDRWGAVMPARIGPGPDNPLGLRALNWNRPGGGDTLIRFHGTPNEASIGSASSNGCVRMFNEDVIELYDMVSSGTTIISLA
ncbi:MAG: L,D-transpeptidase/peptidoglycan binding protein [Nitriliruptoraceae bacterium]|nr:L,D-transpeptidase/peptidoglycan binding protein [Nitriliruptoraceae bacterium]